MASKIGIVGYGGHVPRQRMARSTIAAAHRWMAPGLRGKATGERAFCNWDEDAVTMAVQAARDATGAGDRRDIARLTLASTTLPFADLQNAAIVAGALSLQEDVGVLDVGHSHRAATSGLLQAMSSECSGRQLFIASDRPRGKPASDMEILVGAGAAALVLGRDDVLAELVASATRTATFVDHFRPATGNFDYYWEERWIRDEGYGRMVPPVVSQALAEAGVAAGEVSHFILPSLFKGAGDKAAARVGIRAEAIAPPLTAECGFVGGAHGLLMLAEVLERAGPGEIIVLCGFGMGVDVLVFRTTDAIASFRPRRGVAAALRRGVVQGDYLRLASFEGTIDLDWGMRGEKAIKTALTEQFRSDFQLADLSAGDCGRCGTVQFPQLPYCVNTACGAPRREFSPHPLQDEPARIITVSADSLSFHPSPPLQVGFIQFDSGARLLMELTDVGTESPEVDTAVEIVFRIKDVDRQRGYPRYFWKAADANA